MVEMSQLRASHLFHMLISYFFGDRTGITDSVSGMCERYVVFCKRVFRHRGILGLSWTSILLPAGAGADGA